MRDIEVKIDGTTSLPAVKFNSMVDENENFIRNTGQTLEAPDISVSLDNQLQIASAVYASNGDFYTDSGSLNAYLLNVVGAKKAPHQYQDGMRARFRPTNNNTGASTVNINTLGLKSIVYQDGTTPLAGGSLVNTHDALIRYSLAIDKFILLNNNLNDLLDVDTSASVAGSTLEKNASGVWQAVNGVALPHSFINGFICENDVGDLEHDITVSAGKARDALDTFNIASASSFTKQIDANWTDGNNNGGFPSSIILTPDTWYYFFEISKPDGTANAGFDTSIVATNLLDGSNAGGAGYTKYRRVASVLTDASSNILNGIWFEMNGATEFYYDVNINDFLTTSAFADADLTISTPVGIITKAIVEIYIESDGGGASTVNARYMAYSKLANENKLIAQALDTGVDIPQGETNIGYIHTDTSSTVRHVGSNFYPSMGNVGLNTLGYIDNRL